MVRWWVGVGRILAAASAALATPVSADTAESCREALLPTLDQSPPRAVTAEDLAQLRDFGGAGEPTFRDDAFAISPDGKHVALQMHRAVPGSNTYCLGVFVAELRADADLKLLDAGGEFIRKRLPFASAVASSTGEPQPLVPAWSPDGRSLAYLKRENGVTQAWVVGLDGSPPRQASASSVDVEAVRWSKDGARLLYSSRPGLAAQERAIDEEGASGFLFDRRFVPRASNRPLVTSPADWEVFSLSSSGGDARTTAESDHRLFDPFESSAWPEGTTAAEISASGFRAWIAPLEPDRFMAPSRLQVRLPGGQSTRCTAACDSVVGFWWNAAGTALWFLRREGWGNSQLAMYRWAPEDGEPRKTFVTDDAYGGCKALGDELVCAYEASLTPRLLIFLDPETGKRRTIIDPNPEFSNLTLGGAQRLHWRNAMGVETYGDLVLPPTHKEGQRHPLVVVQYKTRGFLRGGVGDEYPIQALAANGIAVLSIHRPAPYFVGDAPADQMEYWRAMATDFADRRSVLSSIEAGVELAIAAGVADRRHLGITGLSEGSKSVQFALIHSKMFSAASVSGCCDDEFDYPVLGGEDGMIEDAAFGRPRIVPPDNEFWKNESLALNAPNLKIPLLIQAADDEYLAAIYTMAAMRYYNRPVELYVFPDETHIKWQPAHRLAVYERNIDWFVFWFRGIERGGRNNGAQYQRWRVMRATLSGTSDVVDSSPSSEPKLP